MQQVIVSRYNTDCHTASIGSIVYEYGFGISHRIAGTDNAKTSTISVWFVSLTASPGLEASKYVEVILASSSLHRGYHRPFISAVKAPYSPISERLTQDWGNQSLTSLVSQRSSSSFSPVSSMMRNHSEYIIGRQVASKSMSCGFMVWTSTLKVSRLESTK